MAKRMIDTAFWTDADVIAEFSPEDKYFYLYLMTNPATTTIGIYRLHKKVMAFELGYSIEAVAVLLERFQDKYKKIIFDEELQEVAVLSVLKHNIRRGGTPMLGLIEREISSVAGTKSLVAVYRHMEKWWNLSDRDVDKKIKSLFEDEIQKRKNAHLNNTSTNTITNTITTTTESPPDSGPDSETYRKKYVNDDDDIFQRNLTLNDFALNNNFHLTTLQIKELANIRENYFDDNDDLIRLALLKSAENGVFKYNYVKGILGNWFNHEIKTIEEVEELDRKHKAAKTQSYRPKQSKQETVPETMKKEAKETELSEEQEEALRKKLEETRERLAQKK